MITFILLIANYYKYIFTGTMFHNVDVPAMVVFGVTICIFEGLIEMTLLDMFLNRRR